MTRSFRASNLADQLDLVRFTPLGFSLEELSKLWSIFFQSPYVLSVAYQASAVLIETDDTPFQALPVQTRNLRVLPFHQPVIDRVIALRTGKTRRSLSTPFCPLRARIAGRNHFSIVRWCRDIPVIGGPGADHVQVAEKLPPRRAGRSGAAQDPSAAGTGTPHRGFESNVARFVLRPRINLPIGKTDADPEGFAARLDVAVENGLSIGKSQRVVLSLNGVDGNSAAFSFPALPRDDDTNAVTVPIPGVAPGDYFVRLLIDGAESPLDLDPASAHFGPTVTLP